MAFAALLVLAACQPLGEGGDGDGDTTAPEPPATGTDAAAPGDGDGDGDAQRLTIATGGTGGVYFPLGGALAQELSENIEGVDATATETSASVDNMRLIDSGEADIAFSLGDTASDAVEGRGPFEGAAVDACALANLYGNYTHLITTPDSGITSVEDLPGNRVSVGAPESGTEIIALRILEAAGIDPDADLGERAQLLVDETVEALRDDTVDAGFWSGGLPTGAVSDFAASGDLVLVPLGEYNDALAEEYGPFYVEENIPAGTYDGVEEDISTIVVPNVLVVNTSMSEDLQREITRVLFEQQPDLEAVHEAASELSIATAADVEFMDICPGSQSYYDENA